MNTTFINYKIKDQGTSGTGENFFTAHMAECTYQGGEWRDPSIIDYAPLKLEPSATIFHYGQSVFEGMRAWENREGKLIVFRAQDHLRRLNLSAARLCMPAVPEKLFLSFLEELLVLERKVLDKKPGNFLYLKAFMIATDPSLAAAPSAGFKFLIVCSSLKPEEKKELRVKISEDFSRSANGGVGYTSSGGNYGAVFYPRLLVEREGFQEILWTDAETHTQLEQLGNMNLFIRMGDTLITPPANERVFDGITRKTIFALAAQEGIKVEEREICIKELLDASGRNCLLEMFGTSNLRGLVSVCSFAYKDSEYFIPKVRISYARLLEKKLLEILRK